METQPYAILYNDGAYVVYDLTDEQYGVIKRAMCSDILAIIEGFGILTVRDIRSIVIQKPAPLPPAANPDLTEGDAEYIKENEAEWLEYMKGGKDE